ncbi:hypothetical protein FHS61_002876 [Altererythrobacter atlanticus]|uniref:Uncharacterized protein n=1 Tax=Croceibacterium atlanticum TaxID=1267766 RepID=A0A0F7KWW6_9SPHN|nr:hypothetical protein [Croceibacterium atlanticum]AKH43686.1 hypothetical protein WYH_02656 [Croceibacterium atlanticum]MBB5733830.1 hypothetical protein [Croceibacterium atlanticum]
MRAIRTWNLLRHHLRQNGTVGLLQRRSEMKKHNNRDDGKHRKPADDAGWEDIILRNARRRGFLVASMLAFVVLALFLAALIGSSG